MTAREERDQRVRIGITGLAFVFLLVLLGTVLTKSGADTVDGSADQLAQEEQAPPAEPLAEIGAAPGQAPPETPTTQAPADSDDVIAEALRDDLSGAAAKEGIVEE